MLTILLSMLLAAVPNTIDDAVQADTVDYIFYVDDKRVDPETAKIIKLADIQTITTVKGETAVELYGPEARNGVIDIKTKKGVTLDNKQPLSSNKEKTAHEYVDLGLSVKWATCNVGAEKPEEYGDYYSWGEVEPKPGYTLTNYKFYVSGNSNNDVKFSKYINTSEYGVADNKSQLAPEDDVAHVKWGGKWRIPTKDEIDELHNKCSWTWVDQGNSEFGGVAGYKVTSKKTGYTDRFIFLPAAGYRDIRYSSNVGSAGYYWSSSLLFTSSYAFAISFFTVQLKSYTGSRYIGMSVRPVCP